MGRGVPANGVQPWQIRINPITKHDAVLPPATAVVKDHPHVEFSTVHGLIPSFQKFSKKVRFDGQLLALEGHDFGPMAPHLCAPPSNPLLPTTLVGSKCKWPFTAGRRSIEGKSPCAFLLLFVPYIYCSKPKKKKKKEKQDKGAEGDKPKAEPKPKAKPKPKPGKGGVFDEAEDVLESNFRAAGAALSEVGGALASGAKGAAIGAIAAFPGKLPNAGLIVLPMGPQTVTMNIGLWDYLLGVAGLLADAAFDALWSQFMSARYDGKALSGNAATRRGSAIARATKEKIFHRSAKQLVKGIYKSAEVKGPLKFCKFDLKTGEIKVFKLDPLDTGWKLSDSVPVDYRGWSGLIEAPDPKPPSSPPGRLDAERQATAVLDELLGETPHVG